MASCPSTLDAAVCSANSISDVDISPFIHGREVTSRGGRHPAYSRVPISSSTPSAPAGLVSQCAHTRAYHDTIMPAADETHYQQMVDRHEEEHREFGGRATSAVCVSLMLLSTTALVVLSQSTSAVAKVPSDVLQGENPPLLCYETTASVTQRLSLFSELSSDVHDQEEYQLQVSRSADLVAIINAPTPPFMKQFETYVTTDPRPASGNSTRNRCVKLQVEPFFDKPICSETQPVRRPKLRDAATGACSLASLRHHMPLDHSFDTPSTSYLNARLHTRRLVGGGGGGHRAAASPHAAIEEWRWQPPAQEITVHERGVKYVATVETNVSFELERGAPGRESCRGSAVLRHVLAETRSVLVCRSSAAKCAAAGSSAPRELRTLSETTYDRAPGPAVEPPSLDSCQDDRPSAASAPRAAPPAQHAQPSRSAPSGWDTTAWDAATGRSDDAAGGDGEALWGAEGEPSWLPPAAHLLGVASDASAVAAINAQAGLGWRAADTDYFGAEPLLALRRRLGTLGLEFGTRTLEPSPHLALLMSGGKPLPRRFDAREAWPMCADQIGAVRNQGACGSCWAHGAIETLSDRVCVARRKASPPLSPQSLINCDGHDAGCGGGFVDNAWKFLQQRGATTESCTPYHYCANPAMPNCSFALKPLAPEPLPNGTNGTNASLPPLAPPPPASPPPPPFPPTHCSRCADGRGGHEARRQRVSSAYAASGVGDVEGLQRELMEHGPVEVAFFVYSDFYAYTSGVYRRSAQARGPVGGHAVKLIGWGDDEEGRPYWLLVNSWSPLWGEDGFFRMARGINECEVESTPAAGLPLFEDIDDNAGGSQW